MGKNGDAVRALEADCRATGKTDVTCTIYPEMRHELVNDIGKEQVFGDMLAWLDDRVAAGGQGLDPSSSLSRCQPCGLRCWQGRE